MIQELRHRIYPFTAGRAPWRHDSIPTLCYRGRLVDKGVEAVAANALQGAMASFNSASVCLLLSRIILVPAQFQTTRVARLKVSGISALHFMGSIVLSMKCHSRTTTRAQGRCRASRGSSYLG